MSLPSRVVIMVNSLSLGGAEKQALMLAKQLKRKGTDVSFYSLSMEEGGLAEELRANEIRYYKTELDRYPLLHFRRRLLSLSQWKLGARLNRSLNKINQDLANINATQIIPFTYFPNVVNGNLGGKKVIWNQRDLGIEGMNGNYYEQRALRRVTHFIGNSAAVIDYLRRTVDTRDRQLTLIENSVDPAAPAKTRTEWRKELSVDDKTILLLMVANIHENKDHATVVAALERLKSNAAWKMVFAGKIYESAHRHLQELIRRYGLEHRVQFTGYVQDITGLLGASDIFVFSSASEGSPNAVLEAMSAGKPIVATDIPPVRDLLKDDHPYYFTPGDSTALASCLLQAINVNELRSPVKYDRERFLPERMAGEYLNLFQ